MGVSPPGILTKLTLTVSFYDQAFSVLTDAKQEDERKRQTLCKFYEDTEVCLDIMDGKIRTLLEQNITNYKGKLAWHKENLEQKEYIVLVAGELQGICIFGINNDDIFTKP